MKLEVENMLIIDPLRKNSFWYDGQVALVYDGKRNLSIEATGAISAYFGSDDLHTGYEAVSKAKKLGYTDNDIAIMSKNDQFSDCNWFTIYDQDTKEFLETVDSNYDDAVITAKRIIVGLD